MMLRALASWQALVGQLRLFITVGPVDAGTGRFNLSLK
jgi:hypothetical protein